MAQSDARQAALLSSERKLEEARRQIHSANRSALETEEVGFQTLTELSRQRESVERIGAHVQEVDDNISGARRVMIQMYRRAMAKRAALWCMLIILVITIVVVFYFLVIKKDH
ncbi:unnamed protein product [Cladocopium goreaui]|uniref:Vesicle transport through interaction with t-SNAREs-like 1B n=1 Tax=Cladocopium goreaui TaxID=2562237 RepID=A0A9P1CB37_9DINO|nr:unnamed protein product [Cladocopium goreaui]|eukprot:s472_g14.t1